MCTILLHQVEEPLLETKTAYGVFENFGPIQELIVRRPLKQILVKFARKESVKKAIKYQTVLGYKVHVVTSGASYNEDQKIEYSRHTYNEIDLTDEVKAELDGMGGGPSMGIVNKINRIVMDRQMKTLKRRVPEDTTKVISKKNRLLDLSINDESVNIIEIMSQKAITVEEKFKILDARDKFLRTRLKELDAYAGITRGTCLDMCPEKERLMRQIQHQVSYFEQNSFKEMDPRLAVKQYSRSSADQESPLPHELRPVLVLRRTMDYLVDKIIPLGETQNVNIGDWFHFLWDRTRSIRKDITQQALCCPLTVNLIEQCSRFHIHCSARLVAEDPSVFDQKINTENLTKCLQTLKYMYNDLRLKNVECPNEAEFRAYIILLNLNDANFMWEVQRLPLKIQQSQEIKFAIQLYCSLNSDNYNKFFKFTRETSYLNACILMRYFMQVRNRGMDIILKCYTPRIAKATYPIDDIAKSFGFESTQHAIHFLESCGLKIDDSRTGVILDRSAFIPQDQNSATLERSIVLVESKRKGYSLGQIILKEDNPQFFEPVEPHSSFDENGLLIDNLFFNDDVIEPRIEEITDAQALPEEDAEEVETMEEGSVLDEEEEEEEDEDEEETAYPLDKYMISAPKENVNDSFIVNETPINEVDTEDKSEEEEGVPTNTQTNVNSIFHISKPQTDVNFTWGGSMPAMEMKKPETPSINALFQMLTERSIFNMFPPSKSYIFPGDLYKHEYPDFLFYNILNNPEFLKKKEYHDDDFDLNEIRNYEIPEEEEEEQMDPEIVSLVSEMVQTVESQFKEEEYLNSIKEKLLARRVIRKWLQFVVTRRREAKLQGIISYPRRNLREGASDYEVKSFNYNYRSPRIFEDPSFLDIFQTRLRPKKRIGLDKYAKILGDRYSTFGLKSNYSLKRIYWKCVISTPNLYELETSECIFIDEILNSNFQWEEDGSPLILQEFHGKMAVRFSIVKHIGDCAEKNDVNGFIFIGNEMNENFHKRILKKFDNTGIHYSVPIVIILREESPTSTNFDALVNQGIISSYLILPNFKKHGLMSLVEKGLKYLCENVNNPPPVEINYLDNVLFRNFLCSDLWKRVSCYGKSNPDYGICLRDPNTVIGIYNHGLKMLKQIILDEGCYEYIRFPSEFRQFELECHVPCDYKYLPNVRDDKMYRYVINYLFDEIMTIQYFVNWPPNNEQDLRNIMLAFVKNNFEENHTDILNLLLAQFWQDGNDDIENVIWTDVLELLCAQKFKTYKAHIPCQFEDEWHFFNNLLVVYHTASLDSFLKSDWFYLPNTTLDDCFHFNYDTSPLRYLGRNTPSTREIDETIARVNCTLRDYREFEKSDYSVEDMLTEMGDFSESLLISRRLSSRMQDIFNN